jgi:hypothetical protein
MDWKLVKEVGVEDIERDESERCMVGVSEGGRCSWVYTASYTWVIYPEMEVIMRRQCRPPETT